MIIPDHSGDRALDSLSRALVDGFQRGLPIVERPYARVAAILGASEGAVLERLRRLADRGVLSRVGPVFAPHRTGASTLAALAVPRERLTAVAAMVSAMPEVNHNYEREHEINLWFVVTAPDRSAVQRALRAVAGRSGLPVLDLPMQHAYHIDLGFSPWNRTSPTRPTRGVAVPRRTRTPGLDDLDRRVVAAVQNGLALVARPFEAVAERAGCSHTVAMARIAGLIADGVIRRFGLVVRHHELGYRANAMMVMNVPDHRVDEVGEDVARIPAVTLCYRRPRRAPRWPYNLFCMVHGRERGAVLEVSDGVRARADVAPADSDVLFSVRRFKQRGAWYAGPAFGPATARA